MAATCGEEEWMGEEIEKGSQFYIQILFTFFISTAAQARGHPFPLDSSQCSSNGLPKNTLTPLYSGLCYIYLIRIFYYSPHMQNFHRPIKLCKDYLVSQLPTSYFSIYFLLAGLLHRPAFYFLDPLPSSFPAVFSTGIASYLLILSNSDTSVGKPNLSGAPIKDSSHSATFPFSPFYSCDLLSKCGIL